ncbi:hypothetical protein LCGC14_1617090 [marine sediment metagenome]|uniref:Uncharacterized protein n=1 Tax=marine sediment metagenome TaxID=412755 RepID=A0A0F9KM54_9ZZZZ
MRKVFTIAILVFLVIFNISYSNIFRGSVEAELAIKQLEDSTVSYSISRGAALGLIPFIVWCSGLFIILLMWIPKRKR